MSDELSGERASGESVSVTFRLTIGEYARATAALIRASLGARVVGMAFVVLMIVGIVLSPPIQDVGALLSLIVIPGVIGFAFLTGYLALPICWLAMRRRRDFVESPITFTADDAGLEYSTALYDSHVRWQFVRRVRDVGQYLFFDNVVGASLFVPKRAFDTQGFAALIRLLTDKLPGSGFRVGSPPTILGRFGAWILAAVSIAVIGIVAVLQLGTENPGNLRVGDCFDRPAIGTLDSIARRSCDQPHDAEVIGSLEMPGQPGVAYPSRAGLQDFVDAITDDQIGALLRPGVNPTLLATGVQFPSEPSWSIGDRRVLVYATSALPGKLMSAVGGP